MKKLWKDASLKRVTMVFMVCLFIVPLVAQVGIVTYNVNKVMKERILTGALQNMENATLYVGDILQSYLDAAVDGSENRAIQELAVNANEQNVTDTHYKLRNTIYLSGSNRNRFRYPYDYMLLLYNGTMFTTYTHSPYANYPQVYGQITAQSWFLRLKSAYSQGTALFTAPDMLNPTNNGKLYIARNVLSDGNRGVLCICIDQSFLAAAIEKTKIVESGNVFLFDKSGDVLVEGYSNTISMRELQNSAGDLRQHIGSPKISRLPLKLDGASQNYLIMSHNLVLRGYDTDLTVLSIVPEQHLMGEANSIINTSLLLVMLYLAGVGLATWLLGKVIINPIVTLNALMKEVTAGNLSIRAQGLPGNEIGQLGDGFNAMLERLTKNIDEIRKAEDEKRKVEIKLLQSQIKPHFVRNMMNSIIWLANLKGAKSISRSITALSNLLEYNFKDTRLFSTVQNELNYVREYVYLQKVRYQHKIFDEYTVEEELMGCPVLKLTFQPIVENAIVHGILNRSGTGTVRISGHLQEGEMVFVIADDGVGMSNAAVSHLLEPSQEKYDDIDHIALWNINKRIQAQYGQQYGISIESTVDEGTRVTLRLPVCRKEEETE